MDKHLNENIYAIAPYDCYIFLNSIKVGRVAKIIYGTGRLNLYGMFNLFLISLALANGGSLFSYLHIQK